MPGTRTGDLAGAKPYLKALGDSCPAHYTKLRDELNAAVTNKQDSAWLSRLSSLSSISSFSTLSSPPWLSSLSPLSLCTYLSCHPGVPC